MLLSMCRRLMSWEECDERLAAGWFVDEESEDNASAMRRRYLKSEHERLASLVRSKRKRTDSAAH